MSKTIVVISPWFYVGIVAPFAKLSSALNLLPSLNRAADRSNPMARDFDELKNGQCESDKSQFDHQGASIALAAIVSVVRGETQMIP